MKARVPIALASALLLVAVEAVSAQSIGEAFQAEVETAMRGLDEIQRRSLVLCARGKVSINYRDTVAHNLTKGGSDETWALKVNSLSQKLLSLAASGAQWPEIERYFEIESQNAASLVRGDISRSEYVKRSKDNEGVLAIALGPERARQGVHASNFARLDPACTQLSNTVIVQSKIDSTRR